MRIAPWLGSRWQDRQGQALVEFALVIPLLLLFLLAIIQMGLLFNGFITIQQAARIGVRDASLGESTQSVGCAIHNQIATDGLFPSSAVVYWSISSSPTTSTPSAAPSGSPPSSTSASATSSSSSSPSPSATSSPSPAPSASGSLSTVSVKVSTDYPLIVPIPGFSNKIPMGQSYTMVQEDPSQGDQSTTSQYTCP
ncbi:TadE/TadG family type IV pilus assembly protein [Sulfobacillus sp. hq2]|uniref:TadE/TadG family type IV pilus assembly protein n=1 Tax=Sulfobacillus TaxID=28033 RepID=UPI000CD18088|nr:TadE/TadG family type IV pilus assembly protein [Sulfobacillus sp. hq2]POB09791.1 hypothetical protein CO251_12880 [Sulfobacillus sp. hq2]